MRLDKLLRLMTDKEASDLHLKPMRPPLLRVHGRLMPIDSDPLTPEQVEEMLMEILRPQQKKQLEENLAVDLGYGVHGLARFRGNIYLQRGTMAGSFRRIPYKIQSLDDLELPVVLKEFTTLNMGLVLVTGPTGSGKSTTLAALLRHISTRRMVHILTIEDPIEFLFADHMSTISQREVGTDTPTFAEALRNALRQDPDVIMVGEMRDPETVATVITAAETGHLVFSTLHTNSASQTVDRVLDNFPASQQKQVRAQLAQVLKGVVSMKLVERAGGEGRVAALEILRASPRACELIEKAETTELLHEMEGSVSYYGMQSMNQSLLALLVHGTITYEEAMEQSPDPEDLSLQLRKMFPSIEQQGGDMTSTSDFSQILELQEFRKLYEEQEEKQKLRLEEKDSEIERLNDEIRDLQARAEQDRAQIEEFNRQQERMRAEYKRLRDEAQAKIDKLSERIKELNQKLLSNA
ncbi:MAG: PilT/PilU family type 4a pilus ATPase [Thermoanaerobaculia bacterium]|nr:PilT/PilU family type 4a pilus ATPase [Thermoanaerobaculia bacterium]